MKKQLQQEKAKKDQQPKEKLIINIMLNRN